jgi:hypothetical protein
VTRLKATGWLIAFLAVVCLSTATHAWGPQGHRLVGLIAATYLTETARQNVAWLLGSQTLADVAVWADHYVDGNLQTASWHYVNIPPFAKSYVRDRDCPQQPGASASGRGDRWRDCVVDRILYNQERLADASLDRADRALALKFLVHLVGDVHQPFHALGFERGGNGIQVIAFGSGDCPTDGYTPRPCNLHGIWDNLLIARRKLGDLQYLASLQQLIHHQRLDREPIETPASWAIESHALAKEALRVPLGKIDEEYFSRHITVVDRRLALGGLRLAALVNRSFSDRPPRQSN